MSAGGASTAAAATRRFEVAADAAGRRLDVYLAQQLDETRSRVQRWIRDGRIAVDGALERRPSRPIAAGETIECRPETPRVEGALEPQSGVLDVLWEDEHLVVIDKQPGVAVHPGAGRGDRTLVNFLLERYPEIAQVGHPRRPGIVHRLDLGTSGALAVARTPQAYRRLTEAFAAREVGKLYLAIVYGRPAPAAGAIDATIARDPRERKRMTVTGGGRADDATPSRRGRAAVARGRAAVARGRAALTLYRTLATGGGLSALELDLRTGRTHQIRVHLKSRGVPIVGDPVYGEARWRAFPPERRARLRDFPRPALHAWRLSVPHPAREETITVVAPVPADLRALWSEISQAPLPDPGAGL